MEDNPVLPGAACVRSCARKPSQHSMQKTVPREITGYESMFDYRVSLSIRLFLPMRTVFQEQQPLCENDDFRIREARQNAINLPSCQSLGTHASRLRAREYDSFDFTKIVSASAVRRRQQGLLSSGPKAHPRVKRLHQRI